MTAPLYNAQISAGSLMLPESRRIARLMLTHPDSAAWLDALKTENILQKKSPATARRQARLIRNRLETLDEEAWRLVADGDQELSLQILLAASVKHSRLLGDFIREVVAGHLRRYEHTLSPADWEAFLADCTQRDPAVATWSASTKAKLLQVTLRILAEARYVESTRSLRLKLAESLQVAFDAGAKRILLPMSSVTDIATVPGELFAKFQTSFYSDPVDAVFKALGVE